MDVPPEALAELPVRHMDGVRATSEVNVSPPIAPTGLLPVAPRGADQKKGTDHSSDLRMSPSSAIR